MFSSAAQPEYPVVGELVYYFIYKTCIYVGIYGVVRHVCRNAVIHIKFMCLRIATTLL